MKTRVKIAGASASLFGTSFAGYALGKHVTEKRINNPEHAMSVVLENQHTWRTQYHPTDNKSGRAGAWVSLFKPRFTSCAVFIIFQNTNTKQIHLLQTVQTRVVNGKEQFVSEPASGFFNGEYQSNIPHIVAETAERIIARKHDLGTPIAVEAAYRQAFEEYNSGRLPKDEYQVDQNLWQTAYREVAEETGLDLATLEQQADYVVTKALLGANEYPDQYASVRVINITGAKLPVLAKLIGDEVVNAEWVAIENFDLQNKTVTMSNATLLIKPMMYSYTERLVREFR